MDRRAFLAAAVATVPAAVVADGPKQLADAPKSDKGFAVAAAADRSETPVKFASGGHIECKVSGKDTGGALYVFETTTPAEDRPAGDDHQQTVIGRCQDQTRRCSSRGGARFVSRTSSSPAPRRC